jgi:hypothetical protein
VQPEAFASVPATCVFVHEGEGEIQASGQSFSIAPAVFRLFGGLLASIEGESDHQGADPSLLHQGLEPLQIDREFPAS